MEQLVAVLGAFVVSVVTIRSVHRPESAASGAHRRMNDQLTTRQLWLERLPVPGPSYRIVRLQVATLDRPRLALVHHRRSFVGYFIGKNTRAHVKRCTTTNRKWGLIRMTLVSTRTISNMHCHSDTNCSVVA